MGGEGPVPRGLMSSVIAESVGWHRGPCWQWAVCRIGLVIHA